MGDYFNNGLLNFNFRPKLKAIASSASNTWGLLLLVLLLGYALVEVPRNLWNNANQSYILNRSYFKASKLSSDKCEAEETVDDVLEVSCTNTWIIDSDMLKF